MEKQLGHAQAAREPSSDSTVDDYWYLVAGTPGGVHLYRLSADQVDTVEEIEDLVTRVRADLGFPGGPGVVPDAPWSLDLHPGRPKDVADGATEHDLRRAS